MAKISLIVNGNPVNANVDPRTLLVQFLRENLRLTGTHVGCDTSQCGACVVHLDGKAVKSCTTLAVMADGHEVKTIEGLAPDGAPLHPMHNPLVEPVQFGIDLLAVTLIYCFKPGAKMRGQIAKAANAQLRRRDQLQVRPRLNAFSHVMRH